jgi:hypothetical protein
VSAALDGRRAGLPVAPSPISKRRPAACADAPAPSASVSRPRLRLLLLLPLPLLLPPPFPAAWVSRRQHATRLQAWGLGVRQDEGLPALAGPGEAAR